MCVCECACTCLKEGGTHGAYLATNFSSDLGVFINLNTDFVYT